MKQCKDCEHCLTSYNSCKIGNINYPEAEKCSWYKYETQHEEKEADRWLRKQWYGGRRE